MTGDRLARPNKWLDAAKLEDWISANHPQIWDEYLEFEFTNWVDFWDWLGETHPSLLDEFEKEFKYAMGCLYFRGRLCDSGIRIVHRGIAELLNPDLILSGFEG